MRRTATLTLLSLTLACPALGCGTTEEVDAADANGSGDTASDTATDTGGDSATDTTVPCTGPNPLGCRAEGCPDGQTCRIDATASSCMPSACSCDADTGTWTCTADCGPVYACQPAEQPVCPDAVDIGSSCSDEGLSCSFGQECCCGTCYPSLSCTCTGGSWACFATDACMIPSCEGRPCASDDDCQGGPFDTLACIEGVCAAPTRCADHDATGCEQVDGCTYLFPGCTDDARLSINAGCYPGADCTRDEDCPADHTCLAGVMVDPECGDCDACGVARGVCMPNP